MSENGKPEREGKLDPVIAVRDVDPGQKQTPSVSASVSSHRQIQPGKEQKNIFSPEGHEVWKGMQSCSSIQPDGFTCL
jgi:hypothetical protein